MVDHPVCAKGGGMDVRLPTVDGLGVLFEMYALMDRCGEGEWDDGEVPASQPTP